MYKIIEYKQYINITIPLDLELDITGKTSLESSDPKVAQVLNALEHNPLRDYNNNIVINNTRQYRRRLVT